MSDCIRIGSVVTFDMLDQAFVLLSSIKEHKKPDTKIEYYLFTKFAPNGYSCRCFGQFHTLQSDDFRVVALACEPFRSQINVRDTPYFFFIRCFFPRIFKDFERILYLDIDMVCLRPGIEELWNMPLDGLYVRAVKDPPIHYSPGCTEDMENTGNRQYFNAGMMLMNLEKMRADGVADSLALFCAQPYWGWLKNIHGDQTVLNYLLKDGVGLVPNRWNNIVFGMANGTREGFERFYREEGYEKPLDTLNDTVFLHFAGPDKPWAERSRGCDLVYADVAVEVWNNAVAEYGKKWKETETPGPKEENGI